MKITRSAPVKFALLAILPLPASGYAAISVGTGFFANVAGYSMTSFYVFDEASRIAFKNGKGNAIEAPSADGAALMAKKTVILAAADTEGVMEDEQAEERERAKRLRRAKAEEESRRAEAARKLEAEQTRQTEVNRARATVSNLERRESFLNHEVRWTQRELDSVSRDPADHSTMARRGGLERQLFYLQNQLNQTTTSKQGAMEQLKRLQFR